MIPLRDDNPTKTTPVVTIGIIVAATVVFIYQLTLGPQAGEQFVYLYGAIPAVIMGQQTLPREVMALPPSLSLITSMFLHGGPLHLIGNMLFLWIFGDNIEEAMGHVRFIFFYLICGVVAAMSHAFSNPASVSPMIGASGAISGVLGAYLLLYPRARVYTLIPLGFFFWRAHIPASIMLGFWFVLQLISGTSSVGAAGGGVAWFAHIGGFLAGMALIGFFKHRSVRFFNPPNRRSPRFYTEG
ncbi:MAG TPA: rhomboid family intramembrane serine protease [Nitrospiria bacterium]|jgi:membrane associated rhomboid family serine protease|nr:rhomboid family intramembrane serine protease [Nitrospiria bacterium]